MKITDLEKLELTYDNIIIRLPKEKKEEKKDEWTKSESGIYLPEKTEETKKQKEIYACGVAVVVGSGYHDPNNPNNLIPLKVKKDDFVVINKTEPQNSAVLFSDDENEYRLIREQNVLMKAKENIFEFED